MVFFGILVGCDAAHGLAPISLSVDLRDAPRKLLHATEIIPVRPGAMTLAYPKWIGNEHDSSRGYESWRLGGFDFYNEGELVWLEADAIIRDKTGDKNRSMTS
jgi:hypothetical protein